MALTPTEKAILIERFALDPVEFCRVVLRRIFTQPIPYIHRGLLSIYTGRTRFLWTYGEVWKLVREFVHKDQKDRYVYSIFHVHQDGVELTWEQVRDIEESGLHTTEELAAMLELTFELGKYTAIVIPRGFAKTTICGLAIPLYYALLRTRDFMVYVSESGTHSEMCVNNIRAELGGNEVIIEIFGNLVPERSDSSKKWTEKLFETTTGFAMAARGSGSQIRGLNHKSRRPQVELWDDLQSREDAENPVQRAKLKTWVYQDAMPALPELDEDATIIALGTLLHRDCFLVEILDDPEWTVIRLSVENAWGDYIWPENIDAEKDNRKKLQYQRVGRLAGYYLEYRSQIVVEEAQKFQRSRFIYQPTARNEFAAIVIYCDPAISQKTTGDAAVIQVGGITKKGVVNILDEWRGRSLPDMPTQIIDNYFRLAMQWRPNEHGFEKNGFQASLETSMRTEMFRRGYYFEINGVTNTQNKNARIYGNVHPLHCSGFLHFSRRFPETEDELLGWQLEVKDQADDGPDCMAGIVKLLHNYVGAGIAGNELIDEELEDHEYEDLDVVLGLASGEDWRM